MTRHVYKTDMRVKVLRKNLRAFYVHKHKRSVRVRHRITTYFVHKVLDLRNVYPIGIT